eukprot:1187105-Prorocentrum_minimum.AAC.12
MESSNSDMGQCQGCAQYRRPWAPRTDGKGTMLRMASSGSLTGEFTIPPPARGTEDCHAWRLVGSLGITDCRGLCLTWLGVVLRGGGTLYLIPTAHWARATAVPLPHSTGGVCPPLAIRARTPAARRHRHRHRRRSAHLAGEKGNLKLPEPHEMCLAMMGDAGRTSRWDLLAWV